MNSSSTNKLLLTVRETVVFALFAALMTSWKMLMSPLPNIEPVSLLILVCTSVCGLKALYPVAVFVLVDGIMYGFGLWFISHLYVWPLLVFVAYILRRVKDRLFWAVVSGFFGLAFGALCAIPYLFIGGLPAAISYWVSGLYFDLLHGVGNFAMAVALYPVCSRLFRRLYTKTVLR